MIFIFRVTTFPAVKVTGVPVPIAKCGVFEEGLENPNPCPLGMFWNRFGVDTLAEVVSDGKVVEDVDKVPGIPNL